MLLGESGRGVEASHYLCSHRSLRPFARLDKRLFMKQRFHSAGTGDIEFPNGLPPNATISIKTPLRDLLETERLYVVRLKTLQTTAVRIYVRGRTNKLQWT
jgi:hypothetical protein